MTPTVSRDYPRWFNVVHTPRGWYIVFYVFGAATPILGSRSHRTKDEARRAGIRWQNETCN